LAYCSWVFRAKILRAITKKEWGVLAISSPDNKTVRAITVNFSGDIINVGGKIWVIEKEKVYRFDKPERGFRLDREDLPRRWFDGVPYVFVNESSFLPIDIMGTVGSTRPEEISSVFLAWVNNQLAKGFASFKMHQTLLIITAVLALVGAVFGLMVFQKLGDIEKTLGAVSTRLNAMTDSRLLMDNQQAQTATQTPTSPGGNIVVTPVPVKTNG
jgi:hypothetical protein